MRVILLPSSVSSDARCRRQQFLTSFLIDGRVAIDAGSLGLYGTPGQQARVKHLFLSHTHIDHLASLPLFLDVAYTGDGNCVTIYGSATVLDCLRRDLFNDRVWPDFVRISATRPPYLRLQEVQPEETVTCAGLRITAVPVNHAVPTMGFVIEDDHSAVVIPSDTGPTEAIWQRANATANVKAVFLEVTFPDAQAWLAELARHLTPALFAREVAKLQQPARILAVHIHARWRTQVVQELKALNLPRLEVARFGSAYSF